MAEKFSKFRDAGTGIQVFLTPVPPATSGSAIANVVLPLTAVIGVVRMLLLALFAGIWFAVRGANAFFARTILALLGFYRIKVERVSLRNRGRATSAASASQAEFKPKAGDIIVANWSSWIELLWLAAQFSPVFVLPIAPVPKASETTGSSSGTSSPARRTPRKNAASANTRIETGTDQSSQEIREIKGFRKASLWEMIRRAGYTPIYEGEEADTKPESIDSIAEKAKAPVVVFPELVTSNNRGLLRFSTVFPGSWRLLYRQTGALRIGAGQASIFILSFKHDPPSQLFPTATLSVPNSLSKTNVRGYGWNPLAHVWSLVATLPTPRSLTVRLLDPSESPTGSQYLADPSAVNMSVQDPLSDACAGLIASLSRLKRTNLGWEDKEAFLALMRSRK